MKQAIKSINMQCNGKRYMENKSIIATYVYVTPEFATPIKCVLSVSMARSGGSRTYCDAWIRGVDDAYGAGSGFAGGSGYDRISAAIETALESAGVEFQASFAGRGLTATVFAIEALAASLGHSGGKVLVI
jgi:hypothetical protein